MDSWIAALSGAGVALLLAAAVICYRLVSSLENRLRVIEKELVESRAQPEMKRHTHSTTAAMEDALAILMRLQVEDDYRRAYFERLQAILQTARQSPDAYPVDKPTGPRVGAKVRFRKGDAEVRLWQGRQ